MQNEYTDSESQTSMIQITAKTLYMKITFVNCTINQNDGWNFLIAISAVHAETVSCAKATRFISLKRCRFISNKSPVLDVFGGMNTSCLVNVYITGPTNINENDAKNCVKEYDIFTLIKVRLVLKGPVTISHNKAENIIYCIRGDTLFNKNNIFRSNQDRYIINTKYIKVMQYSNIIFVDNTYKTTSCSSTKSSLYIYCGFQYLKLRNASNISKDNYRIVLKNNHPNDDPYGIKYGLIDCDSRFHQLTTHCEWIPPSVFYGYNPGVVNQQIIQTDQHQLNHHPTICYCSHNITYCSVDVLEPVYPGQALQVELCVTHSYEGSVLYVETHNTQLPASTCKIAELLNAITNYSKTFNFTVVAEHKGMCELFVIASPCLYHIYEAFYIEILPSPVGFTLHNGICDCDTDPDLGNIHIDTCYIDQSTITCPG